MHFAFTGHLHYQDIASWTSDNGHTLTDCSTASLINYPNYLRTVTFDNTKGNDDVKVDYETYDVDNTVQISAYGVTYPKPFKNTAFDLNFGGSDINDFAVDMIDYNLRYLIYPDIDQAGGLYNYLDNLLDFNSVIDSLLKTDLGKLEGVTKISIMAVLRTACFQLENKFVDNPDYTRELISKVIHKITSVEVSDYSCTKFLSTLGFGSTERKGNVGDVISSCLAYMYTADEDRSDDKFILNTLERFERGDNAQAIFDEIVDVALHDLVEDEILPTIQIDPIRFLGNLTIPEQNKLISTVLSGFVDKASGVNDFIPKISAANLVSVVFALGVTDYTSLEDVLNSYLDEYMTKSQMDTIAYEFYSFIDDLTFDENPGKCCDNNTTISYNGRVRVVPTVEDLRLPSGVAVTFGNNASTTRNINWYTKVGVTGTDIEIVPYSQNPKFSGTPTVKGVTSKTERTTREYPGVDLGFIGILKYNFVVNRHTVSLNGLEPGKKYCYRVGDASRGWWSDAGVIETADNSDSFTFLHMSDSQGGFEKQYDVWANTVEKAYNMYPDASFIMHTGDAVDSGTNFKQWNWLFNTASDSLMDTVLMPTTGNHEKSSNADSNYFNLPDLPQQNTETGVYYSFDYNNAHFMVLNTNDLNDDGTLSADQLAWLTNDANNSKKDWKIVAMHKAIYSNGSHYDDKDVVGLRNQLSVLMPELDIDLCLQGHDHVYLRTDSMIANNVVESEKTEVKNNGTSYSAKVKPEGTVYAISGCSGVKYYQTKDVTETDELFPRAETIYDATSPVFSAIEIKGGKLYFNAYTVDNGTATKIDSFAIAKTLTKQEAEGLKNVDDSIIVDPSVSPDVNIPKTAGRTLNTIAIAVPVTAAAVVGFCIYKKKKKSV